MFTPSNLEVLSRQIVATGKTVTAQSVVEMISGGITDAKNSNGNTITGGSPLVFESATSNYISAVALSETKVLAAYNDGGNNNYGTAIILNINTDTISSGTAFVFESANTIYISAVMLSSTKILVAYNDVGNSNYGTSIILNVATDTITSGTAFVFESAETTHMSTTMLSNTKVLVVYSDVGNSGNGTSIILNVSTDTITAGTAYVFEGSISYASVVTLSATKVLVAYADIQTTGYGTSIILNVATDTITSGLAYVFEGQTYYNSATTLSATKVLVTYSDVGNSSYGTGIILNISTDTITSGTAYVFESADTSYTSTITLSATKVLVAYRDSGNSSYGTSIILSINTDTITSGVAFVFESANSIYISAVKLNDTKVLVAYRDGGNSSYGTSIVLNIPLASTVTNVIGIAKQSGVAGSTVLVSYGDEIGGFTGLTQGSTYYLSDDGTLSLVAGTYADKVAIALSTTKIAWLNPIV